MALAGGVSIRVPQKQAICIEGNFVSDGHCHAFDAKAQERLSVTVWELWF